MLHPVDTTVLAIYLAVAVALGLAVARGNRRLDDYLLAGRSLPWWAILGSIVATETSTVTFLSIPGLAYVAGGDLRFLQFAAGLVLGRIVVAYALLPHYFSGKLFTAYELLQQRFGTTVRVVTSVMFLVARNIGDGLRLYLSALVLEQLLPIPLWAAIGIIGAVTIIYTFIGGMKSVVWNDCVQLVVYVAGGILALLIIVGSLADGWTQLFRYADEAGKLRVFDFALTLTDKYSFWAGIIGGAFLTIGTHGTDQLIVQRLLGARSQRDAQVAVVLSGVVVLIQFGLFLLLGIALAAYYATIPTDYPPPDKGDQVLGHFIVHELPAGIGVIGIILAAVFAAAMSTLSSSLNASATAAINDLYRPFSKGEPSDERMVLLSRVLTIVFGVIQIVAAIVGSMSSDTVVGEVLAIAGFTAGVTLGIFTIGLATRHVGARPTLMGVVGGISTLVVIHFATDVAWPWYACIGAFVTVGLALVIARFDKSDVRNKA